VRRGLELGTHFLRHRSKVEGGEQHLSLDTRKKFCITSDLRSSTWTRSDYDLKAKLGHIFRDCASAGESACVVAEKIHLKPRPTKAFDALGAEIYRAHVVATLTSR